MLYAIVDIPFTDGSGQSPTTMQRVASNRISKMAYLKWHMKYALYPARMLHLSSVLCPIGRHNDLDTLIRIVLECLITMRRVIEAEPVRNDERWIYLVVGDSV